MKNFDDVKTDENGFVSFAGEQWKCKYWDIKSCRILHLVKGDFSIEVSQFGEEYFAKVKLNSWRLNNSLLEFKGALPDVLEQSIKTKPAKLSVDGKTWYRSHDDDHYEQWTCLFEGGGAELDYFKKADIEKTGYFSATLHLSKGEMDFSLSCNRILTCEFSQGNFKEAAGKCLSLDDYLQKDGAVLIA